MTSSKYDDNFISEAIEIVDKSVTKMTEITLKFKPECSGLQPETTKDYTVKNN